MKKLRNKPSERYQNRCLCDLNKDELMDIIDDLELKMSPRFWDGGMSKAWHLNIPNLIKAFEALKKYKPHSKEQKDQWIIDKL